jgi:hypothetical protein
MNWRLHIVGHVIASVSNTFRDSVVFPPQAVTLKAQTSHFLKTVLKLVLDTWDWIQFIG